MNSNGRFLVFAPLGADPRNPLILGAIPVPTCFEPNDAMIDTAERMGLDLFVMTGPAESLSPVFFEKGAAIMDRLHSVATAHLN